MVWCLCFLFAGIFSSLGIWRYAQVIVGVSDAGRILMLAFKGTSIFMIAYGIWILPRPFSLPLVLIATFLTIIGAGVTLLLLLLARRKLLE